IRTGDSARARRRAQGAYHVRDRTPALHRSPRLAHRRARAGTRHRGRHAPRTRAGRRTLRGAAAPPDDWCLAPPGEAPNLHVTRATDEVANTARWSPARARGIT